MFGDENVMRLHDRALERALHQGPETIGLQLREDYKGALSKDLLLGSSGQFLHERIEQLVSEFRVVDDDALGGASNNFSGKAADIASYIYD
jgi:hypothetical protein